MSSFLIGMNYLFLVKRITHKPNNKYGSGGSEDSLPHVYVSNPYEVNIYTMVNVISHFKGTLILRTQGRFSLKSLVMDLDSDFP